MHSGYPLPLHAGRGSVAGLSVVVVVTAAALTVVAVVPSSTVILIIGAGWIIGAVACAPDTVPLAKGAFAPGAGVV